MNVRSPCLSRAYSGILFGLIITFVVNISLRAQVQQSPSAAPMPTLTNAPSDKKSEIPQGK